MTRTNRLTLVVASLALAGIVGNCTDALAPTTDIEAAIREAGNWPDTLGVAEIATVAASVTNANGASIVGIDLDWSTSDSSIVTIAKVLAPEGSNDGGLLDGLRAVITTHAAGNATIIARVNRGGFAAAELRFPVVVDSGSWPSVMTVSRAITAGIAVDRAAGDILEGATVTWQSGDQTVLKAVRLTADDFRADFTPRASGSVTVTATITGPRIGRTVLQLPVNVGALRVSQDTSPRWPTLMTVADSTALKVIVRDARGVLLTDVPVQWRSSNTLAAFIDAATGKIKALREGGTEIIATAGNPEFQTSEFRATITVGNMKVIEASNWRDTLTVTDTTFVTAIVQDATGNTRPGVRVQWSSTNPLVFRVDSTGIATARVIALSQGGGEIIATVGSGEFQTSEHRASMLVLPLGVIPTTDWPDTLTVTDSVPVAVTVAGTGTDPRASVVRWSSTNTAAFIVTATSSSAARVIALSQGGGEIVATVGEPPFQVTERRKTIRVVPLEVVSVGWPATMNTSNDTTLRVMVRDARGNVRTTTRVQWRSTNESVFTIDSTGKVTGLSRGGGEIVATVGGAPFQTSERRGSLRVLQKWRTIDAGWNHACATTDPDRVAYCWGSNRFGELGTGQDPGVTASTPRQVATALRFDELQAGGDSLYPSNFGSIQPQGHTCGRASSMLSCWGASANGQIGDASFPCNPLSFFDIICTRSLPVGVIVNGVFGANTAVRVLQVVAGGRETCAVLLLSAGSDYVTCWGVAGSPAVSVPFGTAPSTSGISAVGGGANVLAGGAHVCAPVLSGIKCYGSNEFGQAGDVADGFVRDNVSGANLSFALLGGVGLGNGGRYATGGGNHSCMISGIFFGVSAGNVLCWGLNSSGQLGAPSSETCSALPCSHRAVQVSLPAGASFVSAGNNHTCAIVSGDAYCWGSNADGQLGNGSFGGSSQVPVLVGGGIKFTAISAGTGFTCALAVDGSPYCWGSNTKGQLGDGTTVRRTLPVRIGEPGS